MKRFIKSTSVTREGIKGSITIQGSEWLELQTGKRLAKLQRLQDAIVDRFEEIDYVDLDYRDRDGFRGGKAGFDMVFTVYFDDPRKEEVVIESKFTRDLSQVAAESILREFTREYTDYIKYTTD